jgi:hypothetical protein
MSRQASSSFWAPSGAMKVKESSSMFSLRTPIYARGALAATMLAIPL